MTTTPQIGDVVTVRFPEEPFTVPGPKFRPCIVLDVQTNGGLPMVLVAYGTSKHPDAAYRGNFKASPADKQHWRGMKDKATRFDLSKTTTIPLTEKWFGDVVGHVRTDVLLRRFKVAYGELNGRK